MRLGTTKSRTVGNRNGMPGTKHTVILDHHDRRVHHVDTLPHPVVISVDIDAQQANLTSELVPSEKIVYVLSINKRRRRCQVMLPIITASADGRHIHETTVHDK